MDKIVKSLCKPSLEHPCIVVDKSPESIQTGALTGDYDILATVLKTRDRTLGGIEFNPEARALYNQVACLPVSEMLGRTGGYAGEILRFTQNDTVKGKLVLAGFKTLGGPRQIFLKGIADVQIAFLAGRNVTKIYLPDNFFAWTYS